jgi:cytochrome c oxidase subunit 2
MRLKQDAMPGMDGDLQFTPIIPGDYPILCSQVCGLGHGRMQARLRVVSQSDYDRWFAARERALAAASEAKP